MYSKIESKFWMDEKTTIISPEARYIMLYLLTSPHKNMLGFYYLPKPYIIHDVKLSPERFELGFRELLGSKMIFYDEKASVMLLPNYLKHNPLDNPNVVKSAIEKLDELPKNSLEPLFLQALQRYGKPFYQPLIENVKERLNTSPVDAPETEMIRTETASEPPKEESVAIDVTATNGTTNHEETADEDFNKGIDKLEKRFGELTGRLIPSPKDIQNMQKALQIAKDRADLVISIMEEVAKDYKPPYPGAKIRTFSYFLPAIQEKIALFEAKQSTTPTPKAMTPEERQQSEKLTQEIIEAIPDEILQELGGINSE